MEEKDRVTIEGIINNTTINNNTLKLMERMIKKYIDSTASICFGCPSQIKYSYKRLKDWYSDYTKYN